MIKEYIIVKIGNNREKNSYWKSFHSIYESFVFDINEARHYDNVESAEKDINDILKRYNVILSTETIYTAE